MKMKNFPAQYMVLIIAFMLAACSSTTSTSATAVPTKILATPQTVPSTATTTPKVYDYKDLTVSMIMTGSESEWHAINIASFRDTAIEALKEAGLIPAEDFKIVSIDAKSAAFKAMLNGDLNVTVECSLWMIQI